jgi:hypothetical protein
VINIPLKCSSGTDRLNIAGDFILFIFDILLVEFLLNKPIPSILKCLILILLLITITIIL